MNKSDKRVTATVGVLTTLAMGASMAAVPVAAMANDHVEDVTPETAAPEAGSRPSSAKSWKLPSSCGALKSTSYSSCPGPSPAFAANQSTIPST